MPYKVYRKVFHNHVAKAIADIVFSPITFFSCIWLKYLRKDWTYLPVAEHIYKLIGIFPIQNHYYEPLFIFDKHLRHPLSQARELPGIDLNIDGQLSLLSELKFTSEFLTDLNKPREEPKYHFDNGFFGHGDAEFYYNIIRHRKPARIIEIGSGNSTLIANMASQKNYEETGIATSITCIEPYEIGWLESIGVNVERKQVQDIDVSFFMELSADDILFIDSSHMIRPQGDVLYEILRILPVLPPGVLIHIHDIFTPHDYPSNWVTKDHRFWNEQYLLEAFLCFNSSFSIIAALNFLRHHSPAIFQDTLFIDTPGEGIEPASFWITRKK